MMNTNVLLSKNTSYINETFSHINSFVLSRLDYHVKTGVHLKKIIFY